MSDRITKTVSEDGKTTTTYLDGSPVAIHTVCDPVHVKIGPDTPKMKLPKTRKS